MAIVYAAGLRAARGLVGRLGGPGGSAPTSVVASLRTGLQAAWTSPTVRGVLLVTVAMNTLFFPYQHMLPVFARRPGRRPDRARRARRGRRLRRAARRADDRLARRSVRPAPAVRPLRARGAGPPRGAVRLRLVPRVRRAAGRHGPGGAGGSRGAWRARAGL